MQSEQLQNTFGIRDHFLVLGGTLFGFDDLYQFDFVELVDANHAARPHSRGSGFAAKTRSVRAVMNRQFALREDFLAMNIGDWRFGGWNQVQLAQGAGI